MVKAAVMCSNSPPCPPDALNYLWHYPSLDLSWVYKDGHRLDTQQKVLIKPDVDTIDDDAGAEIDWPSGAMDNLIQWEYING